MRRPLRWLLWCAYHAATQAVLLTWRLWLDRTRWEARYAETEEAGTETR